MSKVLKSHKLAIGGEEYTFQLDVLSSYIFYENTGIDMPDLADQLKDGKVMQQVGMMAEIVQAGIEAGYRKQKKQCPVTKYDIIEEFNDPDFLEKVTEVMNGMADDLPAPAKKKKAKK